MTDRDAAPALPEQVAGWRVERRLGAGGLGSVVLARNAAGEPAALKLIDLGGTDSATQGELFEREVAAARRLDHPRIVRVLEAGRAGDLGYIAMEFVGGGDLGQPQLRAQPPSLRQSLRWAADVAQALAHAHAQGVLHRDIKPANILLEENTERAKLADFGLARLADLHGSRTGVLAGTPAYMSPEQLAGGTLDARSDLYSLGVVLFERLAGRLPHEAASLGALLREVSCTPAPPLERFKPDAPPALSALLARLLAKEREHRPADAATLARELEALLATLPAEAPGR
ncbi:MAG: serine/threonine protein kinase [Betaproteobacteria bacterium]|nr:serine/threonine protein kinase [Betaproteobacteria bacterium]